MQDEKLKTHNRYNPSSEIHSAEWVTQGAALTYLLCDSAKAAVSTMHRSAVGRRSIQSFHLIIPPLQLPAEHYPPPPQDHLLPLRLAGVSRSARKTLQSACPLGWHRTGTRRQGWLLPSFDMQMSPTACRCRRTEVSAEKFRWETSELDMALREGGRVAWRFPSPRRSQESWSLPSRGCDGIACLKGESSRMAHDISGF